MKNFPPSRIFRFLMIAFITGIFIAYLINFQKIDFYILAVSSVTLFLLAWLWNRFFVVKFLSVIGLVFLTGIIYYGIFQEKIIPKNIPHDKNVKIEGIIIDEPIISDKNIKYKILIKEAKIKEEEQNNMAGKRVLLIASRYPEYKYGDRLDITGIVQKPGKINDFNYGEYLAKDFIFMIITKPTDVNYISSGNGNWIYANIYKLKNKFESTVNKILAEPYSSLLNGILIGTRQNIPDSLMQMFNIIGITHIIAISGYNVTVIIKSFESLTKYWPKNLSFIICVTGIFLFVILTGASPSVTRAAIFALLFIIATRIGRQGQVLNEMILTAFIMICINPYILRFDIGFQLSFLAVLGLIYFCPIFEKKFRRLGKIVNESLSATLGAQIMTLPVILYNFGRLSIVSPIANILILPIIPSTMFFGFLAGILGIVNLFIGKITGWFCWLLLKYIVEISELLAKIPKASIEINFKNWVFVLFAYIIIIIFVQILNKNLKIKTSGQN